MAGAVGTNLNAVQQAILYLNMKDGGLGLGSATRRHEAAWIGAWEGGMENLLDLLGLETVEQLRTAWPEWSKKIDEVSKSLKSNKEKTHKNSQLQRGNSHHTRVATAKDKKHMPMQPTRKNYAALGLT